MDILIDIMVYCGVGVKRGRLWVVRGGEEVGLVVGGGVL